MAVRRIRKGTLVMVTKTKLLGATFALAVIAVPAASAFATAEEPAAPLAAEKVEQGRALFTDWSCGACHTLADAKAFGSIGPSFDGNTNLDHDFVKERVTNGQGAMPSFAGQMSDEEIDLIASYIVHAKK